MNIFAKWDASCHQFYQDFLSLDWTAKTEENDDEWKTELQKFKFSYMSKLFRWGIYNIWSLSASKMENLVKLKIPSEHIVNHHCVNDQGG